MYSIVIKTKQKSHVGLALSCYVSYKIDLNYLKLAYSATAFLFAKLYFSLFPACDTLVGLKYFSIFTYS